MSQCGAIGCNHNNLREICSFFKLPADAKESANWIRLLKRNPKTLPKVLRVCSCHFRDGLKKNGPELHLTPKKKSRKRKAEASTRQQRCMKKLRFDDSQNQASILLKKQEEEEAQGVFHDIQEQETSGPLLNIKEEITVDECVLEDYLIPKLETFENASSDTTDDVDPLSLSYMEIESRCNPVSPNIAEKFHNKNESADFINIPKLETFENTSEDMVNVEEDFFFSRMQNQPVQETTILRSTLKDNTNFSLSSSNTFYNTKRKLSDQDNRVEDHDFLSLVQVKSENREDYVDYAMFIAARLQNSNQSANAIAVAKEKIELILCDLDKGVFENLIPVPFSGEI